MSVTFTEMQTALDGYFAEVDAALVRAQERLAAAGEPDPDLTDTLSGLQARTEQVRAAFAGAEDVPPGEPVLEGDPFA